MTRVALVFCALFVGVYVVPLGIRPLLVPDETRYAEMAREMLVDGDWVVPRLNGLTYFEKPVLSYWLGAASQAAFGKNRFAARLPSALAAALTTLAVWWLVRRFAGSWAGLLAAMIHASAGIVFGVGVFLVTDGPLALFLTVAMVAFFFASEETTPRRRAAWLALFGASCGLAFLTKGFLAFAVPAVAILPYLVWQRRWAWFLRALWIPVLAMAAIALPWSLLIAQRAPVFWPYFFWVEHVVRFTSGEVQHPQPFWFFVPVILIGALPATALFHPTIGGLRGRGLREPLMRFALCWFAFPFLFFSASRGKLGTYMLPCMPPVAVMLALAFERYPDVRDPAFLRKGLRIASIPLFVAAAAVFALRFAPFPELAPGGAWSLFGPHETAHWLLLVVAIASVGVVLRIAARRPTLAGVYAVYFTCPVLLYLWLQTGLPATIAERKEPEDLLERHADRVDANTMLVAERTLSPAVSWVYERSEVYILDRLDEMGWGKSDEPTALRVLPTARFAEMAASADAQGRHIVLVVTDRTARDCYADGLPEPRFRDEDNGVVWLEYGPSPPTTSETK